MTPRPWGTAKTRAKSHRNAGAYRHYTTNKPDEPAAEAMTTRSTSWVNPYQNAQHKDWTQEDVGTEGESHQLPAAQA